MHLNCRFKLKKDSEMTADEHPNEKKLHES